MDSYSQRTSDTTTGQPPRRDGKPSRCAISPMMTAGSGSRQLVAEGRTNGNALSEMPGSSAKHRQGVVGANQGATDVTHGQVEFCDRLARGSLCSKTSAVGVRAALRPATQR